MKRATLVGPQNFSRKVMSSSTRVRFPRPTDERKFIIFILEQL